VSDPPPASQPAPADSSPGPALIVLLHAYTLSPASLAGLEARIRAQPGFETDAQARFYIPALPLSLLSVADPSALVGRLIDDIDRLMDEPRGPFGRIILIGHSYGALLARKLYVVACGETPQAPFEPAIRARNGRPWAAKIERIILLAGMNRGWRISHHLSPINALLWTFGVLLGYGAWMLRGRKPTIFYIRKGATFITQLRIQWIQLRRQAPARGVGNALTIQLLGSVDDMVSPADNVDLVAGRDFVYRDVPHSGHADVIEVGDPTPLARPAGDGAATRGDARFAVIRDALLLPEPALRAASVIPDDEPPPDADDKVRHVVFVIHGIRDQGYWTHKIARRVQALARGQQTPVAVATETSSYGYFPMLSFLLPNKRRAKVEWLMDQYAEALARYPNAVFSYIGHSNGTYLLARALREYPSCRFEHVVFAGSVVRTRYPWAEALQKGQVKKVLNYVATADWVVAIFPKAIETLRLQDLGSAGHDGFRNGPETSVQQIRYVKGGHGAALAEDNWDAIATFALTGDVVEPLQPLESRKRSPVIALLGYLAPVLWLVIAAVIYAVYNAILHIGIGEGARALLAVGFTLVLWLVMTRV
jgi:pimeloyl-ACP methyl ester carboxylesterase